MADAAESFARGVELQGNLLSRITQRNAAKQQMEQQAALLPLRLQGMENENEMNRLNIVSQGYKNQIEAATIEDQATLTHGTTALALNQDPGELVFKTAPAAAAWMNLKAHSAFGQARAASVASLLSRAAKLDPEHLILFQRDLEQNNGVPSEEGIRALGEGEAYLEDKRIAEQQQAIRFKVGEENKAKLDQIDARNEGNLNVAHERVRTAIINGPGIDPIKKATFLNKARVIRDDPTKSAAAKQQALDELMLQFQAPVAGGSEVPTAKVSPEDQATSENYDGKIAALIKTRTDLEGSLIENKAWFPDSVRKNIAAIDAQINGYKAAKAKAAGQMVVPATPIKVASDGTVTGGKPKTAAAAPTPALSSDRKYTIDDIAAAFGLSDRPAPQVPMADAPLAAPQSSGIPDILLDGQALANGAAARTITAQKFWETVKQRLGVLPHVHSK